MPGSQLGHRHLEVRSSAPLPAGGGLPLAARIVLEELGKRGVQVHFLERPVSQKPEDLLLVQMQGVTSSGRLTTRAGWGGVLNHLTGPGDRI